MPSRRDVLKAALAGIGLPFVHAAPPSPVPWVQNMCRGGASILWRSNILAPGRVEFSEGMSFDSGAAARSTEFPTSFTKLAEPFYLYRADLQDLRPSTEYRYRVFLGGNLVTPPDGVRIRTGGATSFDVVAFGDCGLGTSEQRYVAEQILAGKPALALITGDVVYMAGSYAEYEERFFPYYSEVMRDIPFFPSPGNHDYGTQYLGPYLALHALPTEAVLPREQGRFYSFDWGNAHIVSLDTNASLVDAVTSDGTMLKWLERDLAESNQFWRIVFGHHPPYTWGVHASDSTLELLRKNVVPILDRHRVDLYLAGHEHSYMRSDPMREGAVVGPGSGIVYVTTGGGGANLYPVFKGPGLAYGESAYHHVRIEIRGSRLSSHAIRTDGKEIDAFSLAPTPLICGSFLAPPQAGLKLERDRPVVEIYGRHLATESLRATQVPLPRSLGETRVIEFGRPLPLLSVSDSKIEVQLPHSRHWSRLRVETANGSAETEVVYSERPPDWVCR